MLMRAVVLLLLLVPGAYGHEPVYNVKLYGAKGDNTGDDGPAIRAAIAAIPTGTTQVSALALLGGTVFFPRGKYRITTGICSGGTASGVACTDNTPCTGTGHCVAFGTQGRSLLFRGVNRFSSEIIIVNDAMNGIGLFDFSSGIEELQVTDGSGFAQSGTGIGIIVQGKRSHIWNVGVSQFGGDCLKVIGVDTEIGTNNPNSSDFNHVDVGSCGGSGVHVLQGTGVSDCDQFSFSNVTSSSNVGWGLLNGPTSGPDKGCSKASYVNFQTYNNASGGMYIAGSFNVISAYQDSSNQGNDVIHFGPLAEGNVFFALSPIQNPSAVPALTDEGVNNAVHNVHATQVAGWTKHQMWPQDTLPSCVTRTKGTLIFSNVTNTPCYCDGTSWSKTDGTTCGVPLVNWEGSFAAIYRLEESSGTRINDTTATCGTACDLTPVNSPAQTATHVEGSFANTFTETTHDALSCTGAGCDPARPSTSFTASGYFYRTAASAQDYMMVNTDDGAHGWRMDVNSSQNVSCVVRDAGGGVTATASNGTLALNTWRFASCRFDNATDTITVGAAGFNSYATATQDSMVQDTTAPVALSETTTNLAFEGHMDMVSIAPGKVLTDAQLCRLCSCGIAGDEFGCMCHGTSYTNTGNNVAKCGTCTLPACNAAAP